MGCVYIAKIVNGDVVYVGKTTKPLFMRRRSHECAALRGSESAFCRALRKHGLDQFEWSEAYLSECEAQLLAKEVELIAMYKADGIRLYNMTDGGEGTSGRFHSPETREKIAAKARGRIRSAEACAKTSESMRGKKRSEEFRKALSERKLAYWASRRASGDMTRKNGSTPEGRKRLSENAKARWAARKEFGTMSIGK